MKQFRLHARAKLLALLCGDADDLCGLWSSWRRAIHTLEDGVQLIVVDSDGDLVRVRVGVRVIECRPDDIELVVVESVTNL